MDTLSIFKGITTPVSHTTIVTTHAYAGVFSPLLALSRAIALRTIAGHPLCTRTVVQPILALVLLRSRRRLGRAGGARSRRPAGRGRRAGSPRHPRSSRSPGGEHRFVDFLSAERTFIRHHSKYGVYLLTAFRTIRRHVDTGWSKAHRRPPSLFEIMGSSPHEHAVCSRGSGLNGAIL